MGSFLHKFLHTDTISSVISLRKLGGLRVRGCCQHHRCEAGCADSGSNEVLSAGGFHYRACRLIACLLHQLDLARAPLLGEERFERAVEAQHRYKALARHGLDPVAPFDIRWLRRPEVNRRCAVGGRFRGGRREALAACARETLRRVKHRARHVVVKRERPEVHEGLPIRSWRRRHPHRRVPERQG
jgi:hypothetical protein